MNLFRKSMLPVVVSTTVAFAYILLGIWKVWAGLSGCRPAAVVNLNNPENSFRTSQAAMQDMAAACRILDKDERTAEIVRLSNGYIWSNLNYLDAAEFTETEMYPGSDTTREAISLPNRHNINRLKKFDLVIVCDKADLSTGRKFSYRLIAAPLIAKLIHGRYKGEITGWAHPVLAKTLLWVAERILPMNREAQTGDCEMPRVAVDALVTKCAHNIAEVTILRSADGLARQALSEQTAKGLVTEKDLRALRDHFYDRLAVVDDDHHPVLDKDGNIQYTNIPAFAGRLDTDYPTPPSGLPEENGYTSNGWDGNPEPEEYDEEVLPPNRYNSLLDRSETGREPGIDVLRCGSTLGNGKQDLSDPAYRLEAIQMHEAWTESFSFRLNDRASRFADYLDRDNPDRYG